jgi:8-amino-3,8-dideoxy-alpha-D-manno-octulosonate transaminase
MENHPIIGFNYRISELHAAVGVAQTRKVPYIRENNLKIKQQLQSILSSVNGLSFSQLGDEKGDSGTFLNILLPDTEAAKRTVDEFNNSGVSGFNYWYTNMYHFINQWDHIKEMRTASKLPIQILGAPQDYKNLHLPKTQETVGRLISFGIRCTWTEDEVNNLGNKIVKSINKALTPVVS